MCVVRETGRRGRWPDNQRRIHARGGSVWHAGPAFWGHSPSRSDLAGSREAGAHSVVRAWSRCLPDDRAREPATEEPSPGRDAAPGLCRAALFISLP